VSILQSYTMVQIRRERGPWASNKLQRQRERCLPVALSALIPCLFLLRAFSGDFLRGTRHNINNNFPPNPYVAYLNRLDLNYARRLPGYVVEFQHCDTSGLDWTQFVERVETTLLNTTLAELTKQQQRHSDSEVLLVDQDTAYEFLLQLLEQYLQIQGRCDYSKYKPTVPVSAAVNARLPATCPVVTVISAFRDVSQLASLLRALDDESLCVVVHLESAAVAENNDDYRMAVQEALDSLAASSSAILQFGSVIYRTDSLSLINLRILRWLTDTVDYQFVILLDGSAYPLMSGSELVNRLLSKQQQSDRAVWLGALTHKGKDVAATAWDFRLQRKRLMDSRHKIHKRLDKDAWGDDETTNIPDHIRQHMIYKTTSGNQAIYRHDVVRSLLDSNSVMELFALSKYGCCCCLEEHNWIAALSMIGYAEDGLRQPPMMYQSWGGESSECVGTMNNAVLSRNASLCFRTEVVNATDLYYMGDQTWNKLVDAKKRGYLFARKFDSDRKDSMELLHGIRSEIWGF